MDIRRLLATEPSIFSLAIHDLAVEFLFVKKSDKDWKNKVYKKVSLPKGVVENGLVLNPEKFTQIVREAFAVLPKKVLKKQSYIMISVPDNAIFVKRFEFSNKLDESEIRDAININASIQLPFALSEVYFDTEPRIPLKKDFQELLFIQVKKPFVDPYVAVLKTLNLDVVAVECETLSLLRTMVFETFDPYLIISESDDVGYSFAFVYKKQLRFFCYRKIITAKSPAEIEEQITKLMEYFFNYLEAEFDTAIQNIIFLGEAKSSKIEIFLKIIEEFKAKGKELKLVSAEDVVKPEIKPLLKKVESIKILPVLGLGLRSVIAREDDKLISLLPVGTEESYLVKRSLSYIKAIFEMLVFSSLVLVLLFVATFVFIKFVIGEGMHTSLQASLGRLQSSSFVELENKAKEFNLFLDNAEQASKYKNKISEPLVDLPSLITPGITITSIKGSGEANSQIIVAGTSLTREQAIAFQDNLILSKKFASVDLPLASLASEKNVSFSIVLKRQ